MSRRWIRREPASSPACCSSWTCTRSFPSSSSPTWCVERVARAAALALAHPRPVAPGAAAPESHRGSARGARLCRQFRVSRRLSGWPLRGLPRRAPLVRTICCTLLLLPGLTLSHVVDSQTHSTSMWLAQARRERGPNSLCNRRRGRQVRVHQGERPERSVGSVVIDGRWRRPAAQGRRTARAGSRGAGERAALYNNQTPKARLIPSPLPPSPSAHSRRCASRQRRNLRQQRSLRRRSRERRTRRANPPPSTCSPAPPRLDTPPNLLNSVLSRTILLL